MATKKQKTKHRLDYKYEECSVGADSSGTGEWCLGGWTCKPARPEYSVQLGTDLGTLNNMLGARIFVRGCDAHQVQQIHFHLEGECFPTFYAPIEKYYGKVHTEGYAIMNPN